MNDQTYTLRTFNGHILSGLTEHQLISMYKEDRLPNGWLSSDESPNDVYDLDDVIIVKQDHSDKFLSIREEMSLRELQIENSWREWRRGFVWITFVLISIGFTFAIIATL